MAFLVAYISNDLQSSHGTANAIHNINSTLQITCIT